MRRSCPKRNGAGPRSGQRRENTQVVTTGGEDGQSEGEKPDNESTPKPPAYSQGDLINSIRALNLTVHDKLMDQIMDEPGF